jgi:Tfp pilus assembly protein PilO
VEENSNYNGQLKELLELKSIVLSIEKRLNDTIEKIENTIENENEIIEEFINKLKKIDELDNIKEELSEIKELLKKKKIII